MKTCFKSLEELITKPSLKSHDALNMSVDYFVKYFTLLLTQTVV